MSNVDDDQENDPSLKSTLRQGPGMTEKGFSHRRKVLHSQMQRTAQVMERQMQIMDSLLISEDIDQVNTEKDALTRLYQSFTETNTKFTSCMKKEGPSESEQAEDKEQLAWVEEIDKKYFDHKSRICTWLAQQSKARSRTGSKSTVSRATSGSRLKLNTPTPSRSATRLKLNTLTPEKEATTVDVDQKQETTHTESKPVLSRCSVLEGDSRNQQKGLFKKQMQRTYSLIGKQLSIIDTLLSSSEVEVDAVNGETSCLDRLYQEIMDANMQFSLIPPDERSSIDSEEMKVQDLWMEAVDAAYFAQKQKICNWLIQREKKQKRKSRKRGSSAASSTCSKLSKASDGTHVSRMSKAEADMLHKTKEVELQTELLAIQKKIAKAEAKANVYAEEEERFGSLTQAVNENKHREAAKQTSKGTLIHSTENAGVVQPNTKEVAEARKREISKVELVLKVPKKEVKGAIRNTPEEDMETVTKPVDIRLNEEIKGAAHELTDENTMKTHGGRPMDNSLQETMTKMMKMQSAPTVILDVFSGDPLEYAYFKASFKEVVENTVDDQKGKLTRLIQYTTGEAKNLIKHLIHASHDGYDQAIRVLDAEYGDIHTVTNSYLKELRLWPAIRLNDTTAFKNFYQFLVKCCTYKEGSRLLELDSADMIRTLVLKLHTSYHERWNRLANKIRMKKNRSATFEDFVRFLEDEKKLLCNPMYSKEALAECVTKVKGNLTQVEKKDPKECGTPQGKEVKFLVCNNCSGKHDIEDCREYLDLSIEARHKLVFSKRLCFCCLQPSTEQHVAKLCTDKRQCKVCNEMHPTTLHGDTTFSSNAVTSDTSMVSMCIVQVELCHSDKGTRTRVYALLDECCQGTIIREDIVDVLGITDINYKRMSITTVVGEDESYAPYVVGLTVKGVAPFTQYYEEMEIELPPTFMRPYLAMGEDDVATPSNIKDWDYLDKIKHMIPEYDSSIPFALMLGGDCPLANEPFEFINSQGKGPYAKRTPLGWCVVGPISADKDSKCMKSNFTKIAAPSRDVTSNEIPQHYFRFQSFLSDTFSSRLLQDMYSNEFNEYRSESKAPSREDDYFMKVMEEGVSRLGPHYVLPLPFRDPEVEFPNNIDVAYQRIWPLKRRFTLDRNLHIEYTKIMQKLINLGHARVADTSRDRKGKVWFIPHHAVISEKKGKPRVVFDCNTKYKGRALNEELVQGPDLSNPLVGVLLRFREEDVAVTGDIEGMYLQVKVPEEHSSYLRFLWWPEGNFATEPVVYEMCAHLFGAISSGGCANYALKQAAKDGKDKFGQEAAETLEKNFYVDDLLKSVKDTNSAISLVANVSGMCEDAGFNLTKIVSNCEEVVNSIPIEKRAPSLSESDISKPRIEKPLGVNWHIQNDAFQFSMTFRDLCHPRRRSALLSTITSIYDPLGLVAPFLLPGRKINQSVTKLKGSWDDEVPEELMMRWEEWRMQLVGLQDIKVNRCYKPKGFIPASTSLHCFSDACKIGYGQATYIRHVNKEGEIWVSLALGKSRVVPDKPTTIPRLELVAAKTSALVGTMVNDELSYTNVKMTYWVDSMIALGYILNDTKRFRTFVANKKKTINEYTEKKQWQYVDTASNPADHASRGITPAESDKVHSWLNGPSFLWQPEETWDRQEVEEIPEDDPEVLLPKKVKCNAVKMDEAQKSLLSRLEGLYSCWHYMLIILATMLKFIAKCRRDPCQNMLTVKDMSGAKVAMFKMIQDESFNKEIEQLPLRRGKLSQLNPFLDKDGILRVGGRMEKSSEDFEVKHPVILPKKSTAVKHLVRWHHQLIEHEGRTSTINELRDHGFWVIGCNSLVRSLIHHCSDCRANRGKTIEQKMADLPEERLASEGPFVHCGLDMFGHYIVKEGRKEIKRWGILFTCLSCRGIHLEMVSKADTDSFILALRRFIARRGPVRTIRSDNGGNFVGASNEFEKAYKEMDHNRIRKFLLTKQCDLIDWHRNPPESSHKGGVWERQIRSAKNVLNNILRKHPARLNDEALRTFFVEVESIVNCRPLTVDTLGDESTETLSPHNLLSMKSKVILPPPGNFQEADVYCRKRWRTVQHLANVFWTRWRKEFLSSLQVRQKWKGSSRNLEVGDIVLVKESDSRRNQWPLGRIVQTFPGEDGLVRTVEVKTSGHREPLTRSVVKIVLLVEKEKASQEF